jgi:regulator of sirC expression with transglutaminase-like and TPR domain
MPLASSSDIEFGKLLADQTGINLVRLMLEFAVDAYPDLDRRQCLAEIERLCREARRRVAELSPHATLREKLEAVSDFLYREEGFSGNREQYYDPRNSYLNEVLDRRAGIPITLGVVYMAVAQAAGLPVYGVSAPGHFVLGCADLDERLYIDPFSDGDVLSRNACQQRVERINGEPDSLEEEHFRPASVRDIAVRVLRNLKAAYAMQNQWWDLLPVQQRLTLLLPHVIDEQRDLGLVYLRTGHVTPAIDLLQDYVQQSEPEQAEMLAPYLRAARRMQAEMN